MQCSVWHFLFLKSTTQQWARLGLCSLAGVSFYLPITQSTTPQQAKQRHTVAGISFPNSLIHSFIHSFFLTNSYSRKGSVFPSHALRQSQILYILGIHSSNFFSQQQAKQRNTVAGISFPHSFIHSFIHLFIHSFSQAVIQGKALFPPPPHYIPEIHSSSTLLFLSFLPFLK